MLQIYELVMITVHIFTFTAICAFFPEEADTTDYFDPVVPFEKAFYTLHCTPFPFSRV